MSGGGDIFPATLLSAEEAKYKGKDAKVTLRKARSTHRRLKQALDVDELHQQELAASLQRGKNMAQSESLGHGNLSRFLRHEKSFILTISRSSIDDGPDIRVPVTVDDTVKEVRPKRAFLL